MSGDLPVPLTARPSEGQLVSHDSKEWQTIREGRAFILVPPNVQTSVNPQATQDKQTDGASAVEVPQNVFYNPIQQFNRDLSVLAMRVFGEDLCRMKEARSETSRTKARDKQNRKQKRKREEEIATGDEGQPTSKVVKTGDTTADANGDHESVHTPADESVKTRKPSLRILDALSATGLRALRFASEIEQVTSVVANDMDPRAVKSIKMNILHNDLSHVITPNTGNAIGYMYSVAYPVSNNSTANKFDVIDLDPYGTAAPFIDAALQALNDGGLLCVTCTDSGVFASCGYPEKTFSLYGGLPVKGPHSHEAGLRIILQSIAATAGKYGISIEPLLSLSVDFYVRMFVRIRRSPADVKFLAGKTMVVYNCDAGCGAWTTQILGRNVQQQGKNDNTWWKHSINQAPTADRKCEHCNGKTHVAGPMWAGPIHNADFIERLMQAARLADKDVYHTLPRIEGMLDTALDELSVIDNVEEVWAREGNGEGRDMLTRTAPHVIDCHPFFFIPSALAKVLRCQAPPEAALKGALRHAGYRAVRSHCKPGSIKTNAPWSAIWHIMREWVRQKSPVKEGSLTEKQFGWKILYGPHVNDTTAAHAMTPLDTPNALSFTATENSQEPKTFAVVFDETLGKDKGRKLLRYQTNPRENWGPMTRAKGKP